MLELGCGEGHLTEAVLREAKRVTGIDISGIAVNRALMRNLTNAEFLRCDFLEYPFSGYDIITALECICYLSSDELERFFHKVKTEHRGKILAISIPIIGSNEHRTYFTHAQVMNALKHHSFSEINNFNLTVYWRPLAARIAANLCKLPFGHHAVDILPERFIYQRLYLAIA